MKLATILLIGALGFFLAFSPTMGVSLFRTSAESGSLVKVSSGLVASDPLDHNLTMAQLEKAYWSFSGDAPEEGAQYNFYENSGGLYIGVQAANSSTYAGFFAVSPNTNFVLAHVQITAPVKTVPSGNYESGIYLQTADGNVSYVTCTSSATSQGTIWEVVWATGNSRGAQHYKTLWSSGLGMPLTENCTIITNGDNYLKVILGGQQVYSNSSLELQMPEPFQIYLEPETSYTGAELYASFLNYYQTAGEYLTVNGLPSNAAKVELVNPKNGKVLAGSATQGSSASLEIADFAFPLGAEIKVLDSTNNILSSTSGRVSIYGGDSYSYVGGNLTLTIKTDTLSGTKLKGIFAYITNSSGQTVRQGYSTLKYSHAIQGQTYTACVDNYEQYNFQHWSNGSTNPCLTVDVTKNTTLTAYYST